MDVKRNIEDSVGKPEGNRHIGKHKSVEGRVLKLIYRQIK
jgi:hypothetical protein